MKNWVSLGSFDKCIRSYVLQCSKFRQKISFILQEFEGHWYETSSDGFQKLQRFARITTTYTTSFLYIMHVQVREEKSYVWVLDHAPTSMHAAEYVLNNSVYYVNVLKCTAWDERGVRY